MTTFAYTTGNPSNLTAGATASMNDIQGPFTDVRTFFNGRTLNEDNLPVATLQRLALNDSSGQTGRGKSIIAAAGTRTNVAYGALSNGPDQVSVVLPTDGIITVTFRAYWASSVSAAGRAAIFIGANQVKVPQANVTTGTLQEVATAGTNVNNWLFTNGTGLGGTDGTVTGMELTDGVTTGLVLGGLNVSASGTGGECKFEAAAGTYTVSVQFKATSGTVTATNRKLWVKAESYA